MPEIISNYIELHICHATDAGRKYLLLKRAGNNRIYPNLWQMITGGVEVDESTATAVKRELFEETGITDAKIYVVPRVNTFYLAAIDKVCLSPVFLAIVKSDAVKISDEHSEYKWVTVDEARNLVHWPNQIESMELIEINLGDDKLFTKLVEIKL